MAKYTEKLAKEIIRFIEQDIYTISEICSMLRINRKTFYEWKNTKPDFKQEVDAAMERRNEALVAIARSSLRKKLEGYTLTEVKEVYEPSKGNPTQMILKSRVEKKKEYAPDNRCIQMVLERHAMAEEKKKLEEDKESMEYQREETKEERLNRLLMTMNPKTEEHRNIVIHFNENIEKDIQEHKKKQQEMGLKPEFGQCYTGFYKKG